MCRFNEKSERAIAKRKKPPSGTSGKGRAARRPRSGGLAVLFHRRWTVPAIARLHHHCGAKFISLVNWTGASRPALRQALDESITRGWIRRNPGYGHPLRPEYMLTNPGARLGPGCLRLMEHINRLQVEDAALRKWSMPILLALEAQPLRFGELRRTLGIITDRALTLAIKDLLQATLIQRQVLDEFPPATIYSLTRSGRSMTGELAVLADAV